MSRIGKKPIPLPAGVKYKVEGNTVLVEGPKGKVSALIAEGISLETKDGVLHVNRESDKHAAVHGLTRALVFNAVQGVTAGWKKELDIVGIGYRAELKGKNTVVFTLGYSHPIEFPLPTGIEVAVDPKQTHLTSPASTGRRWARWPPTCVRCASPIHTRTRACATPTRS
jgi:large subunit ribosomal protein L6